MHDTTIIARFRTRPPVACFPAVTLKPVSGCRTTILQSIARRFKPWKAIGRCSPVSGQSQNTSPFSLYTMLSARLDIVAGSDDLGVVVGCLFLFLPMFNNIHQRPDVVLIPGGTIQPTVCREVLATRSQFRGLAKQGFQLHRQFFAFRAGRRLDAERHRDFVRSLAPKYSVQFLPFVFLFGAT